MPQSTLDKHGARALIAPVFILTGLLLSHPAYTFATNPDARRAAVADISLAFTSAKDGIVGIARRALLQRDVLPPEVQEVMPVTSVFLKVRTKGACPAPGQSGSCR